MADYWIASGLLTHTDAVKQRNELLEDTILEAGQTLEVGCYYTKHKELRYGVKIKDEADDGFDLMGWAAAALVFAWMVLGASLGGSIYG